MSESSSYFKVLIPDGESALLKDIVNCLTGITNIKLYIISSDRESAMRLSGYVHRFIHLRNTSDDLYWMRAINHIISENDIDLLMPIDQIAIFRISKHINLVDPSCKVSLLPTPNSINVALNKYTLSQFLIKKGIPHPKTIKKVINKGNRNIDLDFPFMAKPMIDSEGGKGIVIFKNQYMFDQELVNGDLESVEYLFQEYIEGYDIDCSVLCNKGKVLLYTIQRGNNPGRNKFAPHLGVEFVYEPRVFEVAQSLLQELEWTGVAHIDMRYDQKEDTFKIIEINPRFWGSVLASLFAGINFPNELINYSINKEIKPKTYRKTEYQTLFGILKKMKSGHFKYINPVFIWNNTPFKYIFKDPIANLYRVFIWSRRLLLK